MAKKTNLYRAYVIENEELKDIMVDIFDLPYDRFSADCPLVIRDDVLLGRSKGRIIPNMKNIVFAKSLDLGDFRITTDTVLPDELPILICDYSINSMDDLPKKLPSKLQKISIRRALLNNIKKDKDGALASARRFAQAHPRIIVTDGETTLRDLLKDIEREKQKKTSAQPAKEVSKKNTEMDKKTDDYYSTDELIAACRIARPELEKISDEDLARYIKQARSVKAGLKLNPVSLKRDDDAVVTCVHRNCLDKVLQYIISQMSADKERAEKPKVKKEEKSAVVPVAEKTAEADVVYQLNGRNFKTAEITKYIPKRQWGIIQGACGNNKKQLLEILHEINVINVNPSNTDGSKVYYVEDGQIKASRVLELKNSRCLTQGFGNLNSRQRIVWGISGNVFVCVDFFAEHEHALHKYKNVIRNMDLDLSKINLSECYSVTDLINELSAGRDGPSGPDDGGDVPGHTDDSVPDSSIKQSDVVDSVSDTRIVDIAPNAKQVTENKAPDYSNVGVNPTGIVWAELYSMNIKLTQQICTIDTERKRILDNMQVETNTDKLMGMIRELTHNIQRRKRLEEGVSKLHEMNKKLLLFQNKLEKQK